VHRPAADAATAMKPPNAWRVRVGRAQSLRRERASGDLSDCAATAPSHEFRHERPTSRDQRALDANWDPSTDPRLRAWESVHQLIRILESGGEGAAAQLVAKLGSMAEAGR